MNLLKVVSGTIKSILDIINVAATQVAPSILSTTHNLVESANVASETLIVSSVIDQESDIQELMDETQADCTRINARLKARGLTITVPDAKPTIIVEGTDETMQDPLHA